MGSRGTRRTKIGKEHAVWIVSIDGQRKTTVLACGAEDQYEDKCKDMKGSVVRSLSA